MKRNIIFAVIMMLCSPLLMAESLSGEERRKLLSYLPGSLTGIWDDPIIVACRNSAAKGNDKALKSLYVSERALVAIESYQKSRLDAVRRSSSINEGYINLEKYMTSEKMKSNMKFASALPSAKSYCESLVAK